MSRLPEAVRDDWAKLIEEDRIGEIEPDEYTVEMYALEIHKQRRQANYVLLQRVKNGTVTRRRVIINGISYWAYRPVKKGK